MPETTMREATSLASDFHLHLDHCTQCRTRPFNLCRTGERLLEAAATAARDVRSPLIQRGDNSNG